MRKNKKLWSYALAGALAVSNLSGVVAAPFSVIVAQAASEVEVNKIETTGKIHSTPVDKLSANGATVVETSAGAEGIKFTAKATFNKAVEAAPAAVVTIYADKEELGEPISSGFTAEVDEATVTSNKLNATYPITIIPKSGEGESAAAAKAGDYVAKVKITNDTNTKETTYKFSVVDVDENFAILDEDGTDNSMPATIEKGKSLNLSVWNGNVRINEDVTWNIPEDDKEYISIDNAGKVTGKKATPAGEGTEAVPATVTATWKINNDVSVITSGKVTVTGDEEGDDNPQWSVKFGSEEPEIIENRAISAQTMKVGDTATISLLFGDTKKDVAWESKNPNAFSVSNGTVTAIAEGDGYIEGSYSYTEENTVVNEIVKVPITVEAVPEKEGGYFVGSSSKPSEGENVKQGDSLKITYKYIDGSQINGALSWTSNNDKITVNNGKITVSADATVGSTAKIYALIDEESVGSPFTVTVTSAEEEPEGDTYGLEIAGYESDDPYELFYGQDVAITRIKNEDESTEGKLVLSGDTEFFTLSGNTVKATKAGDNKSVAVSWVIDNKPVDADPITIKLVKDAFNVSVNDGKVAVDVGDENEGVQTARAEVTKAEVGETFEIVAAIGNKDITSKMTWTPAKSDFVSVAGGKVTTLSNAKNVEVKGTYTEAGITYKAVLTIGTIITDNGVLEAAESACVNAETASKKADEASSSAEKAIEAAEKAKENPTADNLKTAEAELKTAEKELDEAEKALEKAEDDLAKTEGNKSDAAQAAVEAAGDAVEIAREKVNAAKDAVEFAQNNFAELAPEVEKIRLKEAAIAEAEAAADAALANPTDETIKKANDAVAAAKSKDATDAELKAATDKIAQAVEAKKKADEEAKKKADEEAKKKAEENAKAADGSAKDTPAAAGTELVDANGNKTGFKVTDANASAPEVEYEGPADKNATKADIPETYTDLSGNVYKVVGIDARAFKDTKVKTVTIRKNIKRIDPKAFEKSKVKNVKIKGTKLTKKMAKSFKKLKKGGKIKCSGSHKKKNKEILNNLSTVKNGKTKVK